MTVTVTTVTTISTIAAAELVTTIGAITIAGLMIFLMGKELASATGSVSQICVSKFANVGILPLTIVFFAITLDKIIKVLT